MSRLFDVDDLPKDSPKEARATSEQLYDVEDAEVFKMKFDKEATADLDRLLGYMSRAKTREDVVFGALKILALAVNRDVNIDGKFKGTPKRVSGLWKP